ncbi:1,2-phenylacetyl-CoA epoxidase subunit PaaD [Pelagibius sp. Alg239-R121]|uniref:1,2-phenylacetyl-CoA epoxidase subunit PaaD n=1 Tax=Pelagibius sp. Alg239-R121 TaxID=2993448 RepID=UPI0024A6374F|nr:1,2-phenylacetyl-CoA epoxidase subunit PaaD [Pelagibius sp. Alg239-R121]
MNAAAASHATTPEAAKAWAAAASVCDPEIPVLTLQDLGVLRDLQLDRDGKVLVTITPTYSGCPAMLVMETEILKALREAGFEKVKVETVLSPAWTTDWLSEAGREKLRSYGIAPPVRASSSRQALFGKDSVDCPQCGSSDTERVSEFGSTSCKALYRCCSCAEPFDYFKCL